MTVSKGFSQELLDRVLEQTSLTLQIGNLVNELIRLVEEKRAFLNFLKSRLGDGKGSIFLKMVKNSKGSIYHYYYWRIYENGRRHDIYLGRDGYDSRILNYYAKRLHKLSKKLSEAVRATRHLIEILRELDDISKELQEYVERE